MGKIIDQFETLEEIKKEYPPIIIDKKLKYQPGDIFYATDYSTSLTLLYPTSNKKGGKTTWVAQCSCGKYTVVRNEQLTFKGKNSKRSCGCLKERLGFTTKADWQKGIQPPKKQEEVLEFEINPGIVISKLDIKENDTILVTIDLDKYDLNDAYNIFKIMVNSFPDNNVITTFNGVKISGRHP